MDPLQLGRSLPIWSVLPFAGLLLAIALLPLIAPRFWEKNYGKVNALFGVPVAAWFLLNAPREFLHTAMEYVSFIVLLASLYTISGGIFLKGTFRGTPAGNSAFLGIGAVLANLLGTTGASMLLIRPLLRANAHRKNTAHVYVFFIFIVANIGGALTPIGDPPLFLGYLRGVPFFWTLAHLWSGWLAVTGTVIGIFYVMDVLAARSEGAEVSVTVPAISPETEEKSRFAVEGWWNFLLLAAVLASALLPTPIREAAMAAAAIASAWKTPARIHKENGFEYGPIQEVAVLFAGIFAAMMPALLILKARGGEIGGTEPWHFFWGVGILSSVLDNAPAYLAFFSAAQGVGGPAPVAGVSAPLLKAISTGAVFMGACTYIGNAPNFMVRGIVESAGVRMPSFLHYMGYSAVVLIPVFALYAWLFLG